MTRSQPHIANLPPPAGRNSLRRHVAETLRLGLPVTFARAGALVMVMLDTAMTGRYGSDDLAHYALAHAASMTLMLAGIGMMVGTAVLSAQAQGARSEHECGVIWRVAGLHAIVIGLVAAALCGLGEWLFPLLQQPSNLVGGASNVLLLLGLGMPGTLVFVASSLFLESLGRPRVGLVLMIVANIANAGLNWLMIYGQFGLPAMGAEGAALATTIVRTIMGIAIVIYILRLRDGAQFNVRGPWTDAWAIGRKFRRIGYPLGLAQGLESLSFAALTFIAGLLGAEAVGAFQIVINVVAFCFMTAVGIGTAAAVRVGGAVGRGVATEVALAGWSGLISILGVMAGLAVLLALVPDMIAGLFTVDAGVLAIVIPTLLVGAVTLPSDGAQGVMMGALRGTGDVWVPMMLHLCSFTLVMAPAALGFAVGLGWGAPGLMAGALVGTLVAAILLSGRFHVVSRRTIKRL